MIKTRAFKKKLLDIYSKRNSFEVVVVSVLLYKRTTWALTEKRKKKEARFELHKKPTWTFEQILETKSHKTVAVRSLTSHLTNHPRHVRHWWRSKKDLMSDVLLRTPTNKRVSVWWQARAYIHQHWMQSGQPARSDRLLRRKVRKREIGGRGRGSYQHDLIII